VDSPTLIGLAAAMIFVCGGLLLFGGETSSTNKRAKQIASNGRAGQKSGIFSFLKQDETSSRRKQIEESLGEIEAKQKNKRKKRATLKAKIIQADWTITPQIFMFISLAVGAAVGFGVYMFMGDIKFAGAAAFISGFGVPRWALSFAIGRRQKKFIAHFANAMDIIVRGVRTGLPLGDCLKIIAHESPEPVASEFLLVVEGEALGVPVDVCLERMYERMPLPEVNFFATVLNIQRTTGGNLGESLSNLSNVLRGRKMLREKIKALSAEAKASAMIVGSLPIVVMIIITIASPEYMTELYTTPTGHRNLAIGAGMMMVGTFVMRRMINFKI